MPIILHTESESADAPIVMLRSFAGFTRGQMFDALHDHGAKLSQ